MKHFRNQSFVSEFGKRVMRIRKKQGISQGMLASKAELTYSQISRMERGLINTGISQVKAVADALNIPVSQLFTSEST